MPYKADVGAPRILVFDVNETLLNVNALRPLFEHAFGDGAVLKEWFANTLLYSQSATLAGPYADFTMIARHALRMTANARALHLSEQDADSILAGMRTLPAHPDAPAALQRLHQSGFRLMALTNSPQPVAEAQIQAANLAQMFERIFSVDSVRKYKPHPETYQYVADDLKTTTSELTMIAAHPWDLMGARAAGCNVAFLERPGTPWFHLTPKPKISGATLEEVATQLISLSTNP